MGTGKRRAFSTPAALVLTTVLASVACRQLVGIGDDPPQGTSSDAGAGASESGDEPGPRCGGLLATGGCESCIEAECCPQATHCSGVASCRAVETCLGACHGDAACRAGCTQEMGFGNDDATPALDACIASQCAQACSLICGGLTAVLSPASAASCQSCAASHGCADVDPCATDAGCQATLRCRLAAETLDQEEACYPLVDGGVSRIIAGAAPIAASCAAQCSWGEDWSCAGNVQWPVPTYGAIVFTVQLHDALYGTPIPGATVKLCTSPDTSCTGSVPTGVTGADGSVSITRPPIGIAQPYYFDVSSPEIVPELLFSFYPLSEPTFVVPIPTFTQDEVNATLATAGVTLKPGFGSLLVAQSDCLIGAAPGVTFQLSPPDADTRLFYLIDSVPSLTATSTDVSGSALATNVPALPSHVTLTTFSPDGGALVATMPVFVRDGGLSTVYAVPTQ